MRTVYAEDLFLLELVVDYFLLLAAAKVCAVPFRRGRFLAGAALGAAWSLAALLPRGRWLGLPVMRPVLALAVTLAAFGGQRRLWRCWGAFLGVSALFGGAVFAASLLGGGLPRLDMRVLVLAFALCWAAVSVLFRGAAGGSRRSIHAVTVERGGRTVRFRALADTGNGLYDPLTGCSALVAEAGALAGLFPEEAAYLAGPPAEAVLRIPGARLLPWAGADGQRKLFLVFRPDRVTVDGEVREDLLAGVAPGPIGTDGAYEAVL